MKKIFENTVLRISLIFVNIVLIFAFLFGASFLLPSASYGVIANQLVKTTEFDTGFVFQQNADDISDAQNAKLLDNLNALNLGYERSYDVYNSVSFIADSSQKTFVCDDAGKSFVTPSIIYTSIHSEWVTTNKCYLVAGTYASFEDSAVNPLYLSAAAASALLSDGQVFDDLLGGSVYFMQGETQVKYTIGGVISTSMAQSYAPILQSLYGSFCLAPTRLNPHLPYSKVGLISFNTATFQSTLSNFLNAERSSLSRYLDNVTTVSISNDYVLSSNDSFASSYIKIVDFYNSWLVLTSSIVLFVLAYLLLAVIAVLFLVKKKQNKWWLYVSFASVYLLLMLAGRFLSFSIGGLFVFANAPTFFTAFAVVGLVFALILCFNFWKYLKED
ncbi:MAG: hypothetical protein WC366_04920 [Bacilli bacterium]|jgi:hypothetical protein